MHEKQTEQEDEEKTKQFKYINLGRLHDITKSKPKLMLELISAYLEQTPSLVKAMKESLQQKDWNLLQAAAHKMIPSFSIVGIDVKYEDIAKKIQEHASAKQHLAELQELVPKIETICMQACKELEEEFNIIKHEQNISQS